MKKLVSVLLAGIALGFAFWVATAPIAQAQKPGEGPQGQKPGERPPKTEAPSGKCIVCHFDRNVKGPQAGPHEVAVPCDQADKFVADHPGDSLGECQVTQVQNP